LQQDQHGDLKRLLLAMGLMVLVLVFWTKLFPPAPPPEQPPAGDAATTGLPEGQAPESPAGATPAGAEGAGPVAPLAEAIADDRDRQLSVETDLAQISFRTRGGTISSWKLVEYSDYEEEGPIELVNRRGWILGSLPLQAVTGDPALDARLAEALHRVEVVEGEEGPVVRIRYADGLGLSVEKEVRLRNGTHDLEVRASLEVEGAPVAFRLAWGPGLANHPEAILKNRYFQQPQIVSYRRGEVDTWSKEKHVGEFEASALSWAGLEDNYFAVLFTPDRPTAGFSYTRLETEPEPAEEEEDERKRKRTEREEVLLTLAVPFTPQADAYQLYIGPKKLDVLSAKGDAYSEIIHLGDWIGWIARGLLRALIWIHEHMVGNYGWAIVLLTIAIRLVFFPLTHMSLKKMREMSEKMKKVAPKQKAIKEKYKKIKDMKARQQMNEELMAVYREAGVRPGDQLAGCLPTLIQIPIFFAFFRLLPAAIELRQEPWLLWIQDLSQPDPYWITPIIMGGAMFVSTRMSMSSQPTQMQGFQKQMMFTMPIMFTFFCLWAPSGLVVYWLFSNLFQLGQQTLLYKVLPARAAAKDNGKAKGKPRAEAKSGEGDEEKPAPPKKKAGGKKKRRKKGRR
jgi:YidC/Oxa1 family membrane protein insertase